MQTFMPFENFAESASALDRQRLGKQRVETCQIMQALTGLKYDPESDTVLEYASPASIAKHWVTRMWAGHEHQLMEYQEAVVHEWASIRGYKDSCLEKTRKIFDHAGFDPRPAPEWLGAPEFHLQHQARLVSKNPEFYGPRFPDVSPIDDYDFRWRA